jgi:hypothetical protein
LRLYLNERNIGGERNFTRAVELASGKYTAVFHADDVYAPTIVEREVRTFEAHAEVGAVFALANYINASGETIRRARLPRALRGRSLYDFPGLTTSVLQHGNFLVFPSAMVKTELYKALLPFRVDQFGTSADLDMWLRIARIAPIAVIGESLMGYRISKDQGSYTSRYLRTEPADFFKVTDHYLSECPTLASLPASAVSRYEFMRTVDETRRAANHVISGNLREARLLLRQRIPAGVFFAGMHQPRLLLYCTLGRALGIVGRVPGASKLLRWYLYSWMRRRY